MTWLDSRSGNTIHLSRLDSSPVAIARLTDGSVVFASTEGILARALIKADLKWIGSWPKTFFELKDGDYLTITDGKIEFQDNLGWDTTYRRKYRSVPTNKAVTAGGWGTASSQGAGSSQFVPRTH